MRVLGFLVDQCKDPQFAFFDDALGGFLKSCPNLQAVEGGNIVELGDVIPQFNSLGRRSSRGNSQNGSRLASLDTLGTATKFVVGLTDRDNCRKGKPRWGCKAGTAPPQGYSLARRHDQMSRAGVCLFSRNFNALKPLKMDVLRPNEKRRKSEQSCR